MSVCCVVCQEVQEGLSHAVRFRWQVGKLAGVRNWTNGDYNGDREESGSDFNRPHRRDGAFECHSGGVCNFGSS